MAVYLFDERRWHKDDADEYAEFLKDSVTDLIVLVYGARHGGVIGWESDLIDTAISKSKLPNLIEAMNKRGIRVHAAFQVCRVNRKSIFKPHTNGSKFVDVHDLNFQKFIVDLMSECATLPIDGICMDYVRTDDYRDPVKNDASIESIVKGAYQKIKSVNAQCVVSSTTSPYKDITHPKLLMTGRKAIQWANNGYQDILFDMKYGGNRGEAGDPPDMSLVYKARELTDVPVIVMVSSFRRKSKSNPVPTDAQKFSEVLDSIADEEEIAIYTGWLFTKEQALLVEQMYTY